MFRIGAHVSISGGFPNAVDEEVELGGTAGQLFVGSPRTWATSDVDADEAQAFREAVELEDVRPWIVHGTYLINLATPKDDLAAKSLECVQAELDAAATLDIPFYVFHPGAHTGAGMDVGVENVAHRVSELDIPDETALLFENTAGSGTTVGRDLASLARMIEVTDYDPPDVGICLDTCHLWAAGYDFSTPDDVDDLAAEIDETVGLNTLRYLHLNDSKHPFGSNKDEHAHIGEGDIGEDPFRSLVNHDDFRDLPMVLETPVDEKGYTWNIETVRSLRD